MKYKKRLVKDKCLAWGGGVVEQKLNGMQVYAALP